MTTDFDVVVVGARCAGSPLATLLAREGVRVGVIDQATFPSDTLSTHIFQAPGINLLQRLGVLDDVLASGAELMGRYDYRRGDFTSQGRFPSRPGDAGQQLSVRRIVLDALLVEKAADAGAEVMTATKLVGLEHADGRVSGVRVTSDGEERVITARLVVGADGRTSTLAKLTGSRKYHVVPSERFAYWGFFEGATPPADPTTVFHMWDGRCVIAGNSDAGLYQVILVPDARYLPEFKADRQAAFLDHARACAPVAEAIEGATLAGKLQGILRFDSFFRESAGDGWVLVGDAGQFKDPTPGQGMTDAFRQSAALAPAVVRGLDGSDAELDDAMRDWAKWRDDDAFEHYWLCCDTGASGDGPAALPEMMRRAERRGDLGDFLNLFQHRTTPSKVATPGRLVASTAALARKPGADRRQLLREFRGLIGTEMHRQQLRRKPVYVDANGAAAGAGAAQLESVSA